MFDNYKFRLLNMVFIFYFFLPVLVLPVSLETEIQESKVLIERLKKAVPGTSSADALALEIMQNYQCKLLLKKDKKLGAVFHDLMYGSDGKHGLAKKILDKAKLKIPDKYSSLAKRVESIRNQSSIDAKKPPMDLDFGVLAKDNDDLKYILHEIKKKGGNVNDFHKELDKALKDSFIEVGEDLGLPSPNPEKAFIAGTTGFHPEAYKDIGAIKGNTPLKKWVSQSTDVSRYKINELKKLVDEGVISAESAAQEAARGTLKDFDKVERTFAGTARRTGKSAQLSKINDKLRKLLVELDNAKSPEAIRRAIDKIEVIQGKNGVFKACDNIIDNMEAAWKLSSKSDPELLLKKLFMDMLSKDDYLKTMVSLKRGEIDKLPRSAVELRKKMFHILKEKQTSSLSMKKLFNQLQDSMGMGTVSGNTKQIMIELLEVLENTDDLEILKMTLGNTLAQKLIKSRALTPTVYFKKLCKHMLSAEDYQKTMKALKKGEFNELPQSAVKLRKKIFNILGRKETSLSHTNMYKLFREMQDMLGLSTISENAKATMFKLLKSLEKANDPKILNMVLGDYLADNLVKIRKLVPNTLKSSLAKRLASRISLKTLDNTYTSLELGDGRGALGVDGLIGIAMTYHDIDNIMDKNLSPDEESRELQKAIVSNMPIIGDLMMSINTGIEAGFEGSYSKGAQSAAYLVIAVAGVVPGAQVPALVAGLGMAAGQAGWIVWDAYWDRRLIWSWVKSGVWDKDNGKLLKLKDANGHELSIDFYSLVDHFNEKYKYDYDGMTIRDSILDYTRKRLLNGNKQIKSFEDALHNLYPEADIAEAIRQPGRRGEGLIRAAIKLAGDGKNIDRNIALAIYRKYKKVVDKQSLYAINYLKVQAEREYQAQHHVGEASEVFRKLKALGKRIGVPLVDRVNSIFSSFTGMVKGIAISPFVIESLPLRHVQMAERYYKGYSIIEKQLKEIKHMFAMVHIKMPSHNLSGYLEIDAPRMADLKTTYMNRAIAPARRDAEKAYREITGKQKYHFNPNSADHCQLELFQNIGGILVRKVEAEDRRLLLEQWSGKRSAAETSRDKALQHLKESQKNEDVKMMGIPLPTLKALHKLEDAQESLYVWTHMKWLGTDVYSDALKVQQDRIKKLERDYEKAKNTAAVNLKFCLHDLPEVAIVLSKSKLKKGDSFVAEAKIVKGEMPNEYTWKWFSEGDIRLESSYKSTAKFIVDGNATIGVKLLKKQQPFVEKVKHIVVESEKSKSTLDDKKQNEDMQQKWNWFKNDVPRYLDALSAASRNEYEHLKKEVIQRIVEEKGTQKDVDKCLTEAEKEAKALRKRVREAKREHPLVLRKMHDDQGRDFKVLEHIEQFIHKYQIPENLNVSVHYRSPCVDKRKKAFAIHISRELRLFISPKESVRLKATVTGGKAPVKVSWHGENISPSGTTAVFAATIPGTYTIEVVARDAEGRRVSDALNIKVRKMVEPLLAGLGDTVYYGTTVPIDVSLPGEAVPKTVSSTTGGVDCKKNPDSPFCVSVAPCKNPFDENCQIKIEGATASAVIPTAGDTEDIGPVAEKKTEAYEYVWQSSQEGIVFDPPSGRQPKVNVTFGNIGNVEIWAEVHDEDGVAGETKHVTTKVIPPKLTLTVSPSTAFVGEVHTAEITISPDIQNKYLNFRWLPMGENIQQLGEAKQGRSYRFKTKNIRSSTIEVLVWAVPYAEEQIADLKQVISAKPYRVDVKVLGPLGPKPMVWKEGKGLVEVGQEIAVFQNVRLKAMITPVPKDTVLHYVWKLNEESHFAGGESGSEVVLNRSQVGTCIATVTITDDNGNVLGKGSGSFSVTVSQKQIEKGKQKVQDREKAKQLLREARQLWKEGQLKLAILKTTQAKRLASSDPKVVHIYTEMKKQKEILDRKLRNASQLIKSSQLEKAESILAAAARISTTYGVYKKVLKQLHERQKQKLQRLLKKSRQLQSNGELDNAVSVLKKGMKAFPESRELKKRLQSVQEQKSKAMDKVREGESLWEKGKLAKAVKVLQKSVRLDRSNEQAGQKLQTMQKQKRAIDDRLAKSEADIEKGQLKEAEVQLNKAAQINTHYPRYIAVAEKLKSAKKEADKKKKQQVALLNKAKILQKSGELSKAISVLKKGRTAFPENKKIQHMLKHVVQQREKGLEKVKEGRALWKKGELDKAIRVFKKAAKIFSSSGRIQKALVHMQNQKRSIDRMLVKADRLTEQKKFAKADTVLKQAGAISHNYKPYQEAVKKLNISKRKEAEHQKQLAEEAKQLKREQQSHIPEKILDTEGIDGIVKIDSVDMFAHTKSSSKSTETIIEGKNRSNRSHIVKPKTKTSTQYKPNSKGDVFEGGHWAGASGGSDWLEKDFASPQLVRGVYIGRASTDITTDGFRLVLKLQKTNGKWIIIDELHDTNINRTKLSGGAIGNSIPTYRKILSPVIEAKAFRLEFYGHGWFDATDIRIYTKKAHKTLAPVKTLDTEGIDGIVRIDTVEKHSTKEKSEKRHIVVSYNKNIFPPNTEADDEANANDYVIDGDQSKGWVKLVFKSPLLYNLKNHSIALKLHIGTVPSASSRHGIVVYHQGRVVGRVGAVSRAETVSIPLDVQQIGSGNGSLTFILKAAGTDAAYIKSKASGQGAMLEIGEKGK